MTKVSFSPGLHIPFGKSHFTDFPAVCSGRVRESNASLKDQQPTAITTSHGAERASVRGRALWALPTSSHSLCGWAPAHWNGFFPALPAQGQPLEHPGSLPGLRGTHCLCHSIIATDALASRTQLQQTTAACLAGAAPSTPGTN